MVFGGSWGSTLALAYAQTHPERVTELVLRGIFTFRQSELDWLYRYGASEIFPDKWEEFLAPIPEAERGDLVAAYHRRLTGDDPAVQLAAAKAWSKWEAETVTLLPDPHVIEEHTERRFRDRHRPHRESLHDQQGLARGRPADRQCRHGCRDIPGVIVQGRYDCCTPPVAAWDLQAGLARGRARTSSPTAAICSTSPAILDGLIRATDAFAGR